VRKVYDSMAGSSLAPIVNIKGGMFERTDTRL